LASGHQGVLVIKRGDVIAGLRLLRAGFDDLGEASSAVLRLVAFLMAEALGRAGQTADALAAVEEAIDHSERAEERWLIAELLRVRGGLLLMERAPEAAVMAEGHFGQALNWARRQGALFWELRVALSLARLRVTQSRHDEARRILAPIYDRFTEGFATPDLRAARSILERTAINESLIDRIGAMKVFLGLQHGAGR
jgi:predicted ATPase